MPHQCTTCGRSFADGSKQMLAGCPDCGGNKFQFLPSSALDGREERPGPEGEPRTDDPSASPATAAGDGPDGDIIEAPPEPIEEDASVEDRAQASARRSLISEEELPASEQRDGTDEPARSPTSPSTRTQTQTQTPSPTSSPTPPPTAEDRPDLAQLREELNQQFESIKILRPGEYELNLMELYDREEYIIALEEDGRYVIDVPDTWRDDG